VETTTPPRKSFDWPRLAVAGLIVALIAGFYLSGLHEQFGWEELRRSVNTLKKQVNEHLLLSLLIFFVVYVLVTGLSLPVATPLSLVAGALFGRWVGTGVVSLASTTGATVAFLLSRYLLRDWVERRFGDRLGPIKRGVEADGAYYLFTLRLVPLIPFWLINLGMGLTPMRVGRFAVVSWAGMLLGTFLYVWTGEALEEINSPMEIGTSWKLMLLFVALGLTPLVIRKLLQWHAPRKKQS